jgi:hypothetical protein
MLREVFFFKNKKSDWGEEKQTKKKKWRVIVGLGFFFKIFFFYISSFD